MVHNAPDSVIVQYCFKSYYVLVAINKRFKLELFRLNSITSRKQISAYAMFCYLFTCNCYLRFNFALGVILFAFLCD